MRTPTPWAVGTGPEGQPVNVGPIIGVRSKRHQEALREWRGTRFYDQWRFIVGDADNDMRINFNPNTLRLTPVPRTRP
jgi:hypothetical protein